MPEPNGTAAPSATEAPSPTSAPAATLPPPTATPLLPSGPRLTINGKLVQAGQTTIDIGNGFVTLSLAPAANDRYPVDAFLSLVVTLEFQGYPVLWGGVDTQNGLIASVRMNEDRFVALLVGAPTPTPVPLVTIGGVITGQENLPAGPTFLVTENLTVASGATLTIEPGSVIKFAGTKLQVDGTLIALGTAEEPIVFSSDTGWLGILMKNSSTNSYILNGVIENVDGTALDINDGKVTVIDSIIRGSTQGIWVRSSNTAISDNEIYLNDTGLLTGEANSINLHRNIIRDNNVGIAVVGPKAGLIITENDIRDNVDFNLLVLGTGSTANIRAFGNWWGTKDKLTIDRKIHDRKDDEELSLVILEPLALAPVNPSP